ncbi:MAG: formate/nitrite transporter family protein [Oscillospiraceae bacterium]|nr:formate/nitrite transporter family protein [Oscillospiraceae bacterium]
MTKKIISSVMCGMYISIGATAFLAVGNNPAGAFFFTAGIMLVTAFFGMLVTRVFALFPFKEYKVIDIIIALLGNTVGCVIYAFLLSCTRFANDIHIERIKAIAGFRLDDNFLSLFILSIFCGFLVACACLTPKAFPDNRIASLALTIIFIATFVVCVPEHIVADIFFFAFYSFTVGFEIEMVPILLIVAAGNLIGGMGTGYLEKYRNGAK